MKSYLNAQCKIVRFLVTLALSVVLVGCASQGPEVKVLGVTQPHKPVAEQRIVVYVEVFNPGKHDLRLERLEYRFRASEWFESKGDVRLSRHVAPGASAVLEILVPVQAAGKRTRDSAGGAFTLDGELFARDDRLSRSWPVKARGALKKTASNNSVQAQVATR